MIFILQATVLLLRSTQKPHELYQPVTDKQKFTELSVFLVEHNLLASIWAMISDSSAKSEKQNLLEFWKQITVIAEEPAELSWADPLNDRTRDHFLVILAVHILQTYYRNCSSQRICQALI